MVPTWKMNKGKTSEFLDAGEVTKGMREREIGDLEWFEREGRRKEINLPYAQKDVKT